MTTDDVWCSTLRQNLIEEEVLFREPETNQFYKTAQILLRAFIPADWGLQS